MERFWNIIHYFAYRADCRFKYYLYKYTGIFKLYNCPWTRKRFEKRGIKDSIAYLTDDIESYTFMIAYKLIIGLPIMLLFGLHNFYFLVFFANEVPTFEAYVYPIVVYCIISFVINDYVLFRKDKYLKYFKVFSKMPHQWRVKWAWISFGVILFPYLVLGLSFVAMWYNGKSR